MLYSEFSGGLEGKSRVSFSDRNSLGEGCAEGITICFRVALIN